MQDGATRIFLNTKGKNKEEVSQELIDFLNYVENTTGEVAEKTKSERVKRIHNRVCKVKFSEEIGVKYMQAWEEKYYEREEGRQEGIEQARKDLIAKKLQKGKTLEEIADALEESVETICQLIEEIKNSASQKE